MDAPELLETIKNYILAIREDAEEWTDGKLYHLRALLLVYLIYGGIRHLGDAEYRTIFGGITLGLHEMGHIVLSPFGRTLGIAGGSIFQVLSPLAAAFVLARQRDYFGIGVGLSWLAFAMFELATYIADATMENLPLVGFSDHPQHDWHTLLGDAGILYWDKPLAAICRVLAFGIWGFAIALGVWLCVRMARQRLWPWS